MRIVSKQFNDSVAFHASPRKGELPGDSESGLTLIEMMIVLVIIAIVSGLIAMNVMGRPDEARVTTTRSNLKTIGGALAMYRLDNGDYPTTQQGLDALAKQPLTEPVPQAWHNYLSETPVDA